MNGEIRVKCNGCGESFNQPASAAGWAVACPKCGMQCTVPVPLGHAVQPVQPVAAWPQPPAGQQVTRANRLFEGKQCPACGKEVLLGDEVIVCPGCGRVSHNGCWWSAGGCKVCSAAQVAVGGPTRTCPACAERLPANAAVCPHCGEPLPDGAGANAWVPRSFKATTGFLSLQKWSFEVQGDELIARHNVDEIRIARADAPMQVALKKRKLIFDTPGRRRKFLIDDEGYIATEFWLNGTVTPRRSTMASDALATAIVGICVCGIILAPYALFRAFQAQAIINRYPQVLSGSGLAAAAKVVSIVYLCLLCLGIVAQVIKALA